MNRNSRAIGHAKRTFPKRRKGPKGRKGQLKMAAETKQVKQVKQITDQDSIYLYEFQFKELDLVPLKDLDDVSHCLYAVLSNAKVDIMDIRDGSSGSSSHGIFQDSKYVGPKTFLSRLSITVVTFAPLSPSILDDCLSTTSYKSIYQGRAKRGAIQLVKADHYPAQQLGMFLHFWQHKHNQSGSKCGCPVYKTSLRPLLGCFRGPYMDFSKSVGHFHGASWTSKSNEAIDCMNQLAKGRSVRTASLFDRQTEKEIWCLGFGWQG